jgi:mono/diheme cytochrome c family protein
MATSTPRISTLRIGPVAGVIAAGMIVGLALPAVQAQSPAAAPQDHGTSSPAKPAAGAATPSRALLDQYCVRCHNQRLKTGGLVLDRTVDADDVSLAPDMWERVAKKVRSGAMPPAGLPRPEASAFTSWVSDLEGALDKVAIANPNPGRPAPVHRLNRAEYANAVRDLLAIQIDGRSFLPADDSGYGFDNIGDVLSVSPGLLERYMLAASKVARLAIGDPTLRPGTTTYRSSPLALQDDRTSEQLPFGSRGGFAVPHVFPLDAEYVIKVSLARSLDGAQVKGVHQMDVRIDHALVKQFTVDAAKPETVKNIELRVPVKAGQRLLSVSFVGTIDSSLPRDLRPAPPPPSAFAFQLYPIDPAVSSIDIIGPYDGKVSPDTASRKAIFICQPASAATEKACATRIISALARRAYRRPVTEADIKPLMAAYQVGRADRTFDEGIEWALEAVLSSPKFLFRIERDPANAKSGTPYRVSDLELASRLSFFIWSSIPDETLIDLASRNKLSEPATLTQQVKRMLADPKSKAIVDNFAGQWLWLRNLRTAAPNADLFPRFDDNLREAFLQETALFVESQIREDRPLMELLTANYTFLNERLARHYGIPDVYGSHFRRVTYPDDRRAGLLGQGSVLTVTSYPNRTSPVVRGKWLLENLLGAPPPPPPPNVPALKENGEGGKPTTVRERMEQHRSNPVCAACHARMDPLGFALENFDAVGQWRTEDAEAHTPIDASGTLQDGTRFSTPAEFRKALATRKADFVGSVTERLLTYGLGRGLEYYDAPVVRELLRDARAADYRWSAIIMGIVQSKPFQMRMLPATAGAKTAESNLNNSPGAPGKEVSATSATRRSR